MYCGYYNYLVYVHTYFVYYIYEDIPIQEEQIKRTNTGSSVIVIREKTIHLYLNDFCLMIVNINFNQLQKMVPSRLHVIMS